MKRSPGAGLTFRTAHTWCRCFAVLLAFTACEGSQKLTARLHAWKHASQASTASQATATSQPSAAHLSGPQAGPEATLEVTVVPASGISLLLDGRRVADTSPFVASPLAPGPHVLTVRAMGYHEVNLPVELASGQRLVVPVALRPRPPAKQHQTSANAQGDSEAAMPTDETPRPGPPQGGQAPRGVHGEPLPAGAQGMVLSVQLTPPGPVEVDGVFVPGGHIRLDHGTGLVQVSQARMRYRIYPGHVLELMVPHDGAAWFRDGAQVKAASQLRLEGQPMELRRVSPDGQSWTAVIHRLQ